MSYTQNELNRIVELFGQVQNNKEHEYSAPRYKDSPALKEIAEIVFRCSDDLLETLEETIPALCFLCDCYDAMGRAGMSVKFYKPLLQSQVKLMKLREYSAEEKENVEDWFYRAVKARNHYEPDDCADLVKIVSGNIMQEKIKERLESAMENRRTAIKNDPVEKTEKYLAVIDEVEEKIDKTKKMDFCLEYWNLKAKYLNAHGIHWRSPVELNPGVMFD